MASRKFFWLILGTCVLSAAATMLQLVTVYLMSLAGAADIHDHFKSALEAATDIEKIKTACSSLAQWQESERMGRVKLMIYAPLVALLTSVVCAVLAAWGLVRTRGLNSTQ